MRVFGATDYCRNQGLLSSPRMDSSHQMARTTPPSERKEMACVREAESYPYTAGMKNMFAKDSLGGQYQLSSRE